MRSIQAKYTASITELKKNPSTLLAQAKGEPIAILNHNTPVGYFISAVTYEAMLTLIDERNTSIPLRHFKFRNVHVPKLNRNLIAI